MPVNRRHVLIAPLALCLGPASFAHAEAPAPVLLLMAGAGYRRPVEALCAEFTRQTGIEVERRYGNLQQIVEEASASARMDVLIGDVQTIDQARDAQGPQRLLLGQGKLVLAWRRKLLGRRSPRPITDPVHDLAAMQSITLPNPQQAVYGRAAEQWLKAKGLWSPLHDRLKFVQTVSQVSAYLTSGQIDAGFLNVTEVLAVKGQLGGYVELQPGADSFAPIDIVAAFAASDTRPHAAADRARFAQFLQTAPAREILRKAGL